MYDDFKVLQARNLPDYFAQKIHVFYLFQLRLHMKVLSECLLAAQESHQRGVFTAVYDVQQYKQQLRNVRHHRVCRISSRVFNSCRMKRQRATCSL